jgi:hypothetical protein
LPDQSAPVAATESGGAEAPVAMGRPHVEAYLTKAFDFPALVAHLPEGRQHPQHSCQKIFEAVFWGAVARIASFHQLEYECQAGRLRHHIGPISEDTFRYALERLAPEAVVALGCAVARQVKRNGVLRTAATRGMVVAAVDGIEICRSFVRCCDLCLERTVERVVGGVRQTVVQYYHRIVAVVVVSTPFPIPLGIRFQAPGEGEVRCALALLQDLVGRLGRRFVDVLVGDALYLSAPFVEAIEALGLDWVFTVKDNQPELLAEVERCTRTLPQAQTSGPGEAVDLWHVPEVYWATADRSVRIVTTVRRTETTRLRVERDGAHRRTRKATVWEESTNVYASNLGPLMAAPQLLEAMGRSRWRIDTEVFKTLTTEYHLKHPAVHQQHDRALVVLTMIRVLAYTLMLVFFHRQVLSHCRRRPPSLCQTTERIVQELARPLDDSS